MQGAALQFGGRFVICHVKESHILGGKIMAPIITPLAYEGPWEWDELYQTLVALSDWYREKRRIPLVVLND